MSIKKSKEIAEAIKKARKLMGYTQEDVAKIIGMTTSNYQKIEYSQIKLGIDSRLLDICAALNISIIEILETYYEFNDVYFDPAKKISELNIRDSQPLKSEETETSQLIKIKHDHAEIISNGMHMALRLLKQATNNQKDINKDSLLEIDNQIRTVMTFFDLIKDKKLRGNS